MSGSDPDSYQAIASAFGLLGIAHDEAFWYPDA